MNWEEEIKKIAQWLKKYLEKSGAKGYVLGLSGGLDSAITICLLKRAVGNNIIAINMPCYSSQQAEVDSCDLIHNLKLFEQYAVIDLGYILDCFTTVKNPIFNSQYQMPRSLIEIGNIKARLRMIRLFEMANHYNYLVAGTGNKSEIMTGFYSKFGDGACDISPLANFYKTELYEMAQYLPEIPRSIVEKIPSSDLWPGTSDAREIGFEYSELDPMLQTIDTLDELPGNEEQFLYQISRILGNSEIELNNDKWKKVYNLVKKSEHKRNMPVKYMRNIGE
jgi:NAD+ synthase